MKTKEEMKDVKLLAICCTRKRPAMVKEMLKSFDATKSEGTEIVLYVWNGDPRIEQYKIVLEGRNVLYGDEKFFMADALNFISTEVYPDIPYYQNINDDHYYLVKGWDKMMMKPLEENNGWGISYCTGIGGRSYPNAEVTSGKIVRTLGYYIYPKFRQYSFEPYFEALGPGINAFYHIEGDVIDHRSVNWGYFKSDENHKFIYSKEEIAHGQRTTVEYENVQAKIDIKKIKEAMKNER